MRKLYCIRPLAKLRRSNPHPHTKANTSGGGGCPREATRIKHCLWIRGIVHFSTNDKCQRSYKQSTHFLSF